MYTLTFVIVIIFLIWYFLFSFDSIKKYDFNVVDENGKDKIIRATSFKDAYELSKENGYPFVIRLMNYEQKSATSSVYDGANYKLFSVSLKKNSYMAIDKDELNKTICYDGFESKEEDFFWISNEARSQKNKRITMKGD